MNSRLGRSMLRGLRRAAEFVVELVGRMMRDDEMPSGAGRGIHVTKSGSLYVDLDEIQNSPGSMEAARRGDSVLSAGYRPLHCRADSIIKSWTVRCTKSSTHEQALMIELPADLGKFLSAQNGDTLTVVSKGSGAVVLRNSSDLRS